MNLLVLGGTQFVGRHIVMQALARRHHVTTFTRGQTPDELPATVTRLHGDRAVTSGAGGLEALEGGHWDACIDVSGYLPAAVRRSAEALKDRVGRYLFISTVSVYADPGAAEGERGAVTEDAPLIVLDDPTTEDVRSHYGGLKVLCEQVVAEVYGERATQVRPHIVAGPDDHTRRFTYWPEALAPGQEVLAPGDGSDPVQYIDARDLADFVVHLLEQDAGGVFHVAAPSRSWHAFLNDVSEGLRSQAELIWTPLEQLRDRGLGWTELPLFIPRSEDRGGLMRLDNSRAVAAGLSCRALAETARDTLAWSRTRPADERPVAVPVRPPA